MSIAEIQNNIVKRILQTEDLNILRRLEEFFQLSTEGADWWLTISDEERERIKIGNNEIAEGKVVPHEEVTKAVKERLDKYKK